MIHLRTLALLFCMSLLMAVQAMAQVPQNEGEINLSATETYVTLAPAFTSSTLIPFHVAVEGRDLEVFDVDRGKSECSCQLILPGGTEVNSLNAASLGFEFDVISEGSGAVTSGLFTSFLLLSGTHFLIRLPSTAATGTY